MSQKQRLSIISTSKRPGGRTQNELDSVRRSSERGDPEITEGDGEGLTASHGGSHIATGEGLTASHGGSQITATSQGNSTSTPPRDEVKARGNDTAVLYGVFFFPSLAQKVTRRSIMNGPQALRVDAALNANGRSIPATRIRRDGPRTRTRILYHASTRQP